MAELHHNFEMIEKIKKGIIGVGWAEIEDLTKYNSREEFQKVLEERYPEETRKMSIAVQTGMLYRWTHEVNSGDIAIVPMKINNTIKIGRFTGDKSFRDTSLHPYSHVRSVKWIKDCRRPDFTQDALYSIGSALTLSQPSDLVKTQVELLLEGKKVSISCSGISNFSSVKYESAKY